MTATAECRIDTVQSAFWTTNTGIITAPDGSIILIDAGVFPEELDAIARRIGEGKLIAGLSTHEDWDHVLWSHSLGDQVPRLAYRGTVNILNERRDELLRSLVSAEAELDVRWEHDLAGRLAPLREQSVVMGDVLITVIPTPGHTPGHASYWLPREGVLFAGDMLSDVDIPMLADMPDAITTYRASLERLASLLEGARRIVPGHGTPCDREEGRRRLTLDRAYLDVLEQEMPEIPSTDPRHDRDSNRDAHRQNLTFLAGQPS